MNTPLTTWVAGLTPGNPMTQIANMHTIFNIGTTCCLLPVAGHLVTMAEKILPDKKEKKQWQRNMMEKKEEA